MNKSILRRTCITVAAPVTAMLLAASANAQSIVWGNSAGGGPDIVSKINRDTGALIQNYNVSGGNGRGVVVVGNVLYTTQVGDNHIYETDINTGLPLGSISTSVASMSTIAWDGAHFWTSDYAGSNHAYEIDTSGNVIKTISLTLASGNSDGMEYFNGKLIANRGDTEGPYDVYDLNGNVLQASFINPGTSTTGIAFDGTYFYTSNIFNSSLSVWDGTTGAHVKDISLTGGSFLIEDLSVDYSQRADTGGGGTPGVPDGGSTGLMLAGACLALLAAMKRIAA